MDKSQKMVQPPKELPPIGGVSNVPGEGSKPEMKIGTGQQQPISLPMQPPSIRPQPPQSTAAQPKFQAPAFVPLSPPKPVKKFHLPKIEPPIPRETPEMTANRQAASKQQQLPAHEEELRRFEEAINNINIDVIHTEPSARQARASASQTRISAPATNAATSQKQESQGNGQGKDEEDEPYYHPQGIGEGYFSEIEHYIKHKDVNEIIDDVLKKDFLTGMKDYHDSKSQGKAFYLHKQDLKDKLQKKMEALRCLEEEWHGMKASIEEQEGFKRQLEAQIDSESQELKELFRQVRHTQWLEQESPEGEVFRLRNGQELKSLNDLRKALGYMSDEEFSHHANAERNDFASWARHTLNNADLADKISQAKTKEELQQVLQSPS